MTVIPAVISAVYSVLAVVGIFPKISENALISAFTGIFSVLSVIGVIADPTTAGMGDSDRAMTYDEPFGKDDKQ